MLILVVNLGLKSIRAIVFDPQGRAQAYASLPVGTTLQGEIVEQSPEEWWEGLCAVTREVTQDPAVAKAIALATVTCSSSCLVAVDVGGNACGPAVMVSDRRAAEEAGEIAESPHFRELSAQYAFRSSPFSQMARMVWLKRRNPGQFAKSQYFVSPNDYLIARLGGGRIVTDTLNAEKSYFLPDQRRYPDALYEAFGIPPTMLPEVLEPGAEIGCVAPPVAARLGVSSSTRLRLSTYDAICSVFGTGLHADGMVCDVSGTASSVRLYSRKPHRDPDDRIFCQRFEPANCYLLGGSSNLGGGLIEWAKQCFYRKEELPYEVMEQEARESLPGAKGLVFIPHLMGARAPHWNPDARGVFFGLERFHTRGDMVRAVFESVGFSIREFSEIFRQLHPELRCITASGGLARIPLVNEIKADITGVEYRVMEELESSALGAAMIDLVAAGIHPTYEEAAKSMVRTRSIFPPRTSDRAVYDGLASLHADVYESLKPMFVRKRELMARDFPHPVERIENL